MNAMYDCTSRVLHAVEQHSDVVGGLALRTMSYLRYSKHGRDHPLYKAGMRFKHRG